MKELTKLSRLTSYKLPGKKVSFAKNTKRKKWIYQRGLLKLWIFGKRNIKTVKKIKKRKKKKKKSGVYMLTHCMKKSLPDINPEKE